MDPESEQRLSCSVMRSSMCIGPDGRVCPCMSMMVREDDEAFSSVFRTPLLETLGQMPFMDRCACSVGQVRDANPECRTCAWVERCHGGCCGTPTATAGTFLAIDPGTCHFFKAGLYERFRELVDRVQPAAGLQTT